MYPPALADLTNPIALLNISIPSLTEKNGRCGYVTALSDDTRGHGEIAMKIRIASLLILAISCVASIAAHAAPKCAMTGDWGCFGTIEANTEAVHCKYSTFRNGDRLLEARVERRGKSRFFQKLSIEPLSHDLYNGDDSLYMMAYGMIHVISDAFRATYPDGANTVPEGHSEKTTKIYNVQNAEVPLVLTTDRRQQQIRYSVKFADDATEITGVCDSRLPEPLPDTFDVRKWRHRMPQPIKTLADVRSLKGTPARQSPDTGHKPSP